jgi:hypothetical protein
MAGGFLVTAKTRTLLELLAAVGIAYFIASFTIALSFQTGRLALPSGYDDVVYLIAGQQWLNELPTRGFIGDIGAMLHQHAPLQTLIAALSFVLLGPQDWAPYAANGILLGLTLIAVFWYLRREGTSLVLAILLVLCLVDVPFFQHSVTEFRPDLFAGIVVGFAILLVVSEPAFLMTRKRQLYLGLLFGLALLAKPSAFLAAGFFIATAILFSYSGFLWERKLSVKQQLVPILRSFGSFALGAVAVFGPYLIAEGAAIFSYMYLALFTFADINAYHGTQAQQFSFYVTGPAGRLALGFWFWLGIATMLLRLGVAHAVAPERLPTLYASYASLLVMFVVLALTVHKSYFLGSMFYATFSLLMVRDLARLAETKKFAVGRFQVPAVLAVLAVLVGIQKAFLPNKPLATSTTDGNYHAMVGGSTHYAWQIVWNKAHPSGAAPVPVNILINSPHPVRTAAIMLDATRRRFTVTVADGVYPKTTEDFMALADKADLVIVTASMDYPYPGTKHGNELQALMAKDTRFRKSGMFMEDFVQFYERVVASAPHKPLSSGADRQDAKSGRVD